MVEEAGGGFVLIHVATPLEECERRDRKGLYARARAGAIADFTGISSPYEEPRDAIRIDTTGRDIASCLDELMNVLTFQGWLHS
jgi:sulfate adenylyltransferase